MIVNVISLVIQNIISKNQSLIKRNLIENESKKQEFTNRFLSLYDYNFLLVIEKIRKRNSNKHKMKTENNK